MSVEVWKPEEDVERQRTILLGFLDGFRTKVLNAVRFSSPEPCESILSVDFGTQEVNTPQDIRYAPNGTTTYRLNVTIHEQREGNNV